MLLMKYFGFVFRIYVDLPDAENRMKILRIFLASENIEPGFQFDELASATEGYSGSDLKVLHCLFVTILNLCCLFLIFFCFAESLYRCGIQACTRTSGGRTEGTHFHSWNMSYLRFPFLVRSVFF